ncbi:MAG: DUF3795 domain-containing protein [Clostridium sulfidigenes]|uniref:DUF3795 domain-containing protein n=1 Tax=Clostridium sulfidigenes TaxID=318464 RepID=A0A927WE57_9CLOT|nr:DUF3795 domain-containing protein [Clostridium sulfidigenes]
MDNKHVMSLIGKCGFYCGSCPDYIQGDCTGCRTAHKKGDCYTFDCVDIHKIEFCGTCYKFPCNEIMTRDKATVLDTRWLQWKATKKITKK